MELATRGPHPVLAPDIRSLAGWYERSDGPVRRAELPRGQVVLVISFGPAMDVNGARFTSFVAGLDDAPALTEHAGLGHGVQANLTPLGARRLLGVPMSELTRQVVELEDLIGGEAAELAERLHDAPSWLARLAMLERLIARRALSAPPTHPALEWAWQRLLDTGGTVPIAELAREIGWSRRHLAATFGRELGMSPKALASLLRFERAAERLRPGADLAELALDSGYYDQAHFNRDFRRFAGTTPSEYRRATAGHEITSIAA